MPRERESEGFEQRRPKREVFVKRDCKLCKDQITIDYKQADLLKKFMTERGKIIASRLTGNCAMHQRQLARAVKRARTMLLVR
jgi:small subunit ribosomal protein S18